MKVRKPVNFILSALYVIVSVCYYLSGVSTELRQFSDKVQHIESSPQLHSSGTKLLPQLSLFKSSVLKYE